MYCAGCGGRINPGLNFCNSCGTKVIDSNYDLRKTIAKNFSIAVGMIGAFGLLGFVILIKSFLENDATEWIIIVTAVLYLGVFSGICGLMINNILKTVSSSDPVIPEKSEPKLVSTPTTKRLDEHREPAQSVVEHTTRALDEVLIEKK